MKSFVFPCCSVSVWALSQCSVDCGVGKRTRNVRCVSEQGGEVSDQECNSRLRPEGSEECNMGPCVTNWYFTGWSRSVSSTHTHRQLQQNTQFTNSNISHIVCLSVFGAVWPRGAEKGGGVSDPRRGQRGWRRGRLCWGETSWDEGLQRGPLCAKDHLVQQPLDTGRMERKEKDRLRF